MATKTYRGSCHCGTVRFEADVDLAAGTGKCNCTICTKSRWWGAIVKPEAFRLHAGEADLADYQFGTKSTHHRFCRQCGVKVFVQGYIEAIGGAFYSISLGALDNIEPHELAQAPVHMRTVATTTGLPRQSRRGICDRRYGCAS